jgi:TPR repeat protein
MATLSSYRHAAEEGDPAAQYILAGCYKYGDGVEENPVEAVRWFRIAAENGDKHAQRSLGLCYARGEGVEIILQRQPSGIAWLLSEAMSMHSPFSTTR